MRAGGITVPMTRSCSEFIAAHFAAVNNRNVCVVVHFSAFLAIGQSSQKRALSTALRRGPRILRLRGPRGTRMSRQCADWHTQKSPLEENADGHVAV